MRYIFKLVAANVVILDHARTVLKAQRELAQDYLENKETIINTWKGLSPERRRKCLLRGVNGGIRGILLNRNDKVSSVCPR